MIHLARLTLGAVTIALTIAFIVLLSVVPWFDLFNHPALKWTLGILTIVIFCYTIGTMLINDWEMGEKFEEIQEEADALAKEVEQWRNVRW